jgi:hypothetical protein
MKRLLNCKQQPLRENQREVRLRKMTTIATSDSQSAAKDDG